METGKRLTDEEKQAAYSAIMSDDWNARSQARAALGNHVLALEVEMWAKAHWDGSPILREGWALSTSPTRRFERVASPVLWDDEDMLELDRETTRRGVRAAIAALRQRAHGETNDR